MNIGKSKKVILQEAYTSYNEDYIFLEVILAFEKSLKGYTEQNNERINGKQVMKELREIVGDTKK